MREQNAILMPSPDAPATTPTAAGWQAHGRRMTDAASVIPTAIELDQPRRGITLTTAGNGSATHLLGLDLRSDCRLADHWLRGDDVTAIYESNDARHLRTTAMWRRHPSVGAARAWELVASAQTSLLQSDSVLAIVSESDATGILWGTCHDGAVHWHSTPSPEATCVLVQGGGATGAAAMSVLVAAHPGDARRMTIRRDGQRIVVECWLFSTALEKGVLLRSRVLAAVGPAADAAHWAGDLVATFAASPPMLTT